MVGDVNLCVHNFEDFIESLQFQRFYGFVTIRNLHISTILGDDTSFSWNLIFYHNLTDLEIKDLERPMTSLSHVHLSLFVPNAKA